MQGGYRGNLPEVKKGSGEMKLDHYHVLMYLGVFGKVVFPKRVL